LSQFLYQWRSKLGKQPSLKEKLDYSLHAVHCLFDEAEKESNTRIKGIVSGVLLAVHKDRENTGRIVADVLLLMSLHAAEKNEVADLKKKPVYQKLAQFKSDSLLCEDYRKLFVALDATAKLGLDGIDGLLLSLLKYR